MRKATANVEFSNLLENAICTEFARTGSYVDNVVRSPD